MTSQLPKRQGFSRVDALIVLAILAMLMGLSPPAINRFRERAKCTACLNNQHDILVAMHNYHQVNLTFPGNGINVQGQVGPDVTGPSFLEPIH
jgi:hypothetical protein